MCLLQAQPIIWSIHTHLSVLGKLRVQTLELGLGAWLLVKCLLQKHEDPSSSPGISLYLPPHTHTGKAETGGSLGHGEQPASLNQEVSGSVRDSLRE